MTTQVQNSLKQNTNASKTTFWLNDCTTEITSFLHVLWF